jgi:Fic/DOC family protein
LLVRSPDAQNNTTKLPHNTSLFDIKANIPAAKEIKIINGLRIYNLSDALIEASPTIFHGNATDVRTALSMISDASDILPKLLDGGHTVIAGRLAGSFRNIGHDRIAEGIIKAMKSADFESIETDPFESKIRGLKISRHTSPYVNRLRMMWSSMREDIIKIFPEAPGLTKNKDDYLKQVEEVYLTDAYHSLSIEGYKVTPELIEKVSKGNWNPEEDENDREARNALAARGYYQAFQEVLKSLNDVLNGKNPGEVVNIHHGDWYRELFAPSVTAGIIKPSDLAGYRNGQVYIKKSMHVPLNKGAVRDAMPEFFDLLSNETHPAARVVLGHFVFVYIHPYMDGNGRIARFLTNLMLASGGYPWTVVPLYKRNPYMEAIEEASVNQNIVPFTELLAELVTEEMKGNPLAKI